MSELPYKLAEGEHPIVVSAVRDNALEEFKAAVERQYVHIKFTETRGGTELGFELDDERSDFSNGDLDAGTGKVRVAGRIKLDGVPVWVVGDIDLAKMAGKGHLEIIEEEESSDDEDKPN